jgi:hypothetical protein
VSRPRNTEVTGPVIDRFEAQLRERGLLENLQATSVAVIVDGKPLGKTYLRDLLDRRGGDPKFIEAICEHHVISWDYVKNGNGSVPQTDTRLEALLEEWRELCARKHALEEEIVAITARK